MESGKIGFFEARLIPPSLLLNGIFLQFRERVLLPRGWDVLDSGDEARRKAPQPDETPRPEWPEAGEGLRGQRLGDLAHPGGQVTAGAGERLPAGTGPGGVARLSRRR